MAHLVFTTPYSLPPTGNQIRGKVYQRVHKLLETSSLNQITQSINTDHEVVHNAISGNILKSCYSSDKSCYSSGFSNTGKGTPISSLTSLSTGISNTGKGTPISSLTSLSTGISNTGKGTPISSLTSLSTGISNSEKEIPVVSHPTRTKTCSELIIDTPSSFLTSPSIPVIKERLTTPSDPTTPRSRQDRIRKYHDDTDNITKSKFVKTLSDSVATSRDTSHETSCDVDDVQISCERDKGQTTDGILHVNEHTQQHILEKVKTLLIGNKEIAMTLVFNDGSTLLHQVKTSTTSADSHVEAVSIALSHSSKLYLIMFHMVSSSSDIGQWIRSQLVSLFRYTTIIGYQMTELLTTVITHFNINTYKDISGWNILDVGIASYLLNPDDTETCYQMLLSHYNIQHTTLSNKQAMLTLKQDITSLGSLMVKLYHRLKNEDLWMLFSRLEMRIVPLIAAMESNGIIVDTNTLTYSCQILKEKLLQVERSAHSIVGHEFCINSTTQLREVLYSELKLNEKCTKVLGKTPVHKHTSTSETVLTQLESFHPLPKLVLKYRQLSKLKGFIENILSHVSEDKLNPCWQLVGAATGRITCCNPNIQAFPKQATNININEDKTNVMNIDIRKAIQSRSGHTFVAIDFRSIELRLLTHLSGDINLLHVLSSQPLSTDVFKLLASNWLGMSPESVTQSDRERTKRVVYAVIYGVGKDRLSEILHITPEYAKELMHSFLGKYNGIKKFIQTTIEHCRITKCCSTLCGRKRWFKNINSSIYQLRTYSERQAVNFVVQGSAADICKIAMIKIHEHFAKHHIFIRLLLQVHDELLYEVLNDNVHIIADQLKSLMESPVLLEDFISTSLKVPLKVRISTGTTWSTLQDAVLAQ